VLAAVAAVAALDGHASRLAGLGTLEGKESPRRSGLAGALGALGLAVLSDAGTLAIGPAPGVSARRTAPLVLDPRGDHRMAFAFALLGLAWPALCVADPGCVDKSWPGFWEELGARLRMEERAG
jgi:3-phosphoshikimate 1-carboxyvinyltransferase